MRTHIQTHTDTHTRTHSQRHTSTLAHTHTHAHTCALTHTHTHTHAHTHTHTHPSHSVTLCESIAVHCPTLTPFHRLLCYPGPISPTPRFPGVSGGCPLVGRGRGHLSGARKYPQHFGSLTVVMGIFFLSSLPLLSLWDEMLRS